MADVTSRGETQVEEVSEDIALETSQTGEHVKDKAQHAKEQALEQAQSLRQKASDKTSDLLDEQKHRVADELGVMCHALQQAADSLRSDNDSRMASYVDAAADRLEQVSHTLRDRETGDLADQLRDFARRRPDVFLGGTFVAGLLLARFLKSSGSKA